MPDKTCQTSNRPGIVVPVVDFNRCEGKNACVAICPYDVFELRTIDKQDYRGLSLVGKIRNRMHGGMVAYTPRADQCHACGLCVDACPELAIKLVKATGLASGASGA